MAEKNKNVFVIAFAVLLMMLLGVIYSWTIFVSPLEQQWGWDTSQTANIFTLSMMFFCIGNISGGILNKRIKSRYIFALSAISLVTGFWALAYVSRLWQFAFLYGMVCSFGIGLSYNTVIAVLSVKYPQKLGTLTGALMMGYGCGTMVFGNVVQYLFFAADYQRVFQFLAFAFGSLLLGASFIIKEEKPRIEKFPAKRTTAWYEMFRTSKFYFYYLWGTCLTVVGMFIVGKSSVLLDFISDNKILLLVCAGAVSVVNGLGRMAGGFVFDCLGMKKTTVLLTAGMMTGVLLLMAARSMKTDIVTFVGILICAFMFGGTAPSFTVFARKGYGTANYTVNFPILSSMVIPGSVLGSTVTGYFMRSHNGDFQSSLYFLFGIMVLGILMNIIFLRTYYEKKEGGYYEKI